MEEIILIYLKRLNSQDFTHKRFENTLTKIKSNLLKRLPDKEEFIELVWKNLLIYVLPLFLMKKLLLKSQSPRLLNLQKKQISYMQEFLPKNNWMTLIDKLNSCKTTDLNICNTLLLVIFLQGLTSKEKDFKPFWTPAYKELSEKLLSPIETVSVGSDSNSYNSSLQKVEEQSKLLTVKPINLLNKNSQKTYYQLSTSTVVSKWEKEVINPNKELKMLKIKLKPSLQQKKVLNEWFDTSLYVYNKALDCIKKGHNPYDKQGLRNILVTYETRISNTEYSTLKTEQTQLEKVKNVMDIEKENTKEIEKRINELKQKIKDLPIHKNPIQEWELKTPKDIRASAIDDLITAHKSGFTNLKKGHIKYFKVDYKKKDVNRRCFSLPKALVKNDEGTIKIAPTCFKKYFNNISCEFEMGLRTKKKFKDLKIEHDCKILKDENRYWILIPVPLIIKPREKPINYCGIDPGSRTFMTTFGNKGCFEYEHNKKRIDNIDKKIKENLNRTTVKRVRKNTLRRLEYKKRNIIDEIHWKTIIELVKENDVLFYGDIKSHDIVKEGKNKTLNRDLNNLKMFQFKNRFIHKTKEWNKLLFVLGEEYTTRTCSFCGTQNDPKSSKIYYCKKCNIEIGRDVNASKNILMKGIQTFL